MILGAFLEFILGNTFPFVVFGSFGAFWLTFAATLTPMYNASGAYAPDPTKTYEGASTAGFASTFGFFTLYMGLLCVVYLIVSIRTNVCFFVIFLLLVPAFGCLTGYFWLAAAGTPNPTLLVATGGLTFVVSLLGWYLFLVQLLASVDMPINLPVGDLSGFIKGASERAKKE